MSAGLAIVIGGLAGAAIIGFVVALRVALRRWI